MPDGSLRVSVREVAALEGYHLVERLLERHWDEIAKFKEITVIKPDLTRYQRADEEGRFIGLVAECSCHHGPEVIGYSANFLGQNLHYSDVRFAQNDVLYVMPEHRRSTAGARLMAETIRLAKSKGAQLMLWHAKENTALNALLPRHGYEVMDVIWAKRI